MDETKYNMIVSSLEEAEREMSHKYAKERIHIAETCLSAGFFENVLDTAIVQNILNMLAPFIKNAKIKKAINLLQEVAQEHKKQMKYQGTPWHTR